ncbi:MAG TPA: hypothetical protein VHQ86_01765 [Candidatus Saccharimonadia bacterium]|nr:hypothetical protein [Candidatus Saccharimonadia bacterium]
MKTSFSMLMRRTAALGLLLNLAYPVVIDHPAEAITCTSTVTNTNNSGAGSLRTAMTTGGTICFNIGGGGYQTISPTSALPAIGVAGTVIDGTTQPGYSGVPLIEINGSGAGAGVSGIVVNAGTTTIKGLIVNRFGGDGIILNNNGGNTVQGNYVGTNSAGTAALGNGQSGIGMQTPNNTIGGTSAAQRNLVSGNGGTGIAVTGSGSSGNVIEGNYVGTNAAGTGTIPNGADGVLITQAPNNTVGGTTGVSVGGNCTGACNLLSGNGANGAGIWQSTATGNVIEGNYIGTTPDGLSPLGNHDIGVEAQDAPNNTIGGTSAAARNLISGNGGAGVSLTGTSSTGNNVYGNYIGTDRSGNGSIGNHKMGVNLGSPDGGSSNASGNHIGGITGTTPGGACSGACNVIVSNFWSGIYISGSTGGGNSIAGNFIGVGANGVTPLGNVQDGIGIVGSSSNGIGGPSANARNLISGNGGNGIAVIGGTAGYNRIEGNYIGEATNEANMGNAVSGVALADGIQTAIISNNIANNAQYGIDIYPGGPSPNDGGDADGGPNGTQNFPVLSYAIPLGGSENIAGSLNSLGNTSFNIDFFQSPSCSSSGYGQGRDYMGSTTVTTNASGNASFNVSMPLTIGGMAITATANRMSGSTAVEGSEFSKCVFTPRQHPDGTLIRPAGSSNIFLVEGGATRPIGSGEVLQSYHMSATEFKTATNADTNDPGGSGLYFREGTLIKGSGPNVYVIDQTGPSSWTKRLITNVDFFTALGYTPADVITVPDSALGAPDGATINDASQHPDGTLVKDGNGTIYLLEGGQKRLVGSMPMFITQRYDLNSTKNATSADVARANGSNLNFREGAVVKGSGPNVYIIDDTGSGFAKRRLGSVSAMVELGYSSADVITVADQELPAADGPEI